MAAPRRGVAGKSLKERNFCLPNNTDVRLPPLDESNVPQNAVIYKTRIHADLIAQLIAGEEATIEFDDEACENGIFVINDDGYLLEAQPEPDKSGVNPMSFAFCMTGEEEARCTGKVYKQLDFDRKKVKPDALRRRTSPPQLQPLQKKRSAEEPSDAAERKGSSSTAKRQRTAATPLRNARPLSSLNGIGANAPFPSLRKSPGLRVLGNGLRSAKTPPKPQSALRNPRLGRLSPSDVSSPNSPGTVSPPSPQRLEEIRKGIVHFLALGETPEGSLKKRLLDAHESPHVDAPFRKLLREVGTACGKSVYKLNEQWWRDVTEDFALYSEADRKRVRDILARRGKKSSKAGPSGRRSSRTSSLVEFMSLSGSPMIVTDPSSPEIITRALAQFDKRSTRADPIRNEREEKRAHDLWDAWHSVYEQLNKRLDQMWEKMARLGKRYDSARNAEEREKAESAIQDFHDASYEHHQEYTKYLPILHKELKSLLARMKQYAGE